MEWQNRKKRRLNNLQENSHVFIQTKEWWHTTARSSMQSTRRTRGIFFISFCIFHSYCTRIMLVNLYRGTWQRKIKYQWKWKAEKKMKMAQHISKEGTIKHNSTHCVIFHQHWCYTQKNSYLRHIINPGFNYLFSFSVCLFHLHLFLISSISQNTFRERNPWC